MNKNEVISNVVRLIGKKRKELIIPWTKIFLGLSLLTTIAGALFSTKTLANINANIATAKEVARPANVKIVKITTPNCADCFNVDDAVASFKKMNVKVEEEKTLVFDTPEASAVVKQLAIKKVPTYFVTGEVAKSNLDNFVKSNGEVNNNTFVFTKLTPVFIDTGNGQEMGRVTATLLTDSSCSQCLDPKTVVENFKKSGVKVKDLKELAWNSLDGQNIINRYKITKVPTFIFSPEFDQYDTVKTSWPNFGTIENDKTYVVRNLQLPYRDLSKGQVVGLVDLVYLSDSSCSDCYKAQDVQKPILTEGYGVALRLERSVDISSAEGKQLLTRYKITKVPTILISPEVDQYINLKNVWKNVGNIESDGWYVFTGINQLGNVTYRDLITNQVIKPAG